MTKKRVLPKHFLRLYAKFNLNCGLGPFGAAHYSETYACSGCKSGLSKRWHNSPSPVSVYLNRVPRGSVACLTFGSDVSCVYSKALANGLTPYLEGVQVGPVYVTIKGASVLTEYVTLCMPLKHAVNCFRGRYCRNFICPSCSAPSNRIGWAGGGIVSSYLGGRLACMDTHLNVYVASELFEKLDLKAKFPDLRSYIIDLIDEPLDGEVMPGDTNWKGVFVPNYQFPQAPEDARTPRGYWGIP